MKLKIIDNLIKDQDVLNALYEYILFYVPHTLCEGSTDSNDKLNIRNRFYSTDFNLDDTAINGLYHTIMGCLKLDVEDYHVGRIHSNIQYAEMGIESEYHTDGCEVTLVFFLSPNIEGGDYIFLDNNIPHHVDYIQNRLIAFDSKILHKALPPINNQPRISIAFKMIKNGKNIST